MGLLGIMLIKGVREREMPYHFTYVWNLKYEINEKKQAETNS